VNPDSQATIDIFPKILSPPLGILKVFIAPHTDQARPNDKKIAINPKLHFTINRA